MSDLNTLMELDPLRFEEKDIDTVILAFREKRRFFNLGNLTAGKVAAKAVPKALAGGTATEIKELFGGGLKI